MQVKALAELLLKTPDAQVLLKVSNDWCEVTGVVGTGQHRNGITLTAYNPHLPGVIVVEPDIDEVK